LTLRPHPPEFTKKILTRATRGSTRPVHVSKHTAPNFYHSYKVMYVLKRKRNNGLRVT